MSDTRNSLNLLIRDHVQINILIIVCGRLSRIKYKEEARKLLFKYAEAAKKMIDSR